MKLRRLSFVWLFISLFITFLIEFIGLLNRWILRPRISFTLMLLVGLFLILYMSQVWLHPKRGSNKKYVPFIRTTLFILLLVILSLMGVFMLTVMPCEETVLRNGESFSKITSVYEDESKYYKQIHFFYLEEAE